MANSSSQPCAPIRIRLFATLREQAGWAEREWPAQADATQRTRPSAGSRNAESLTPRTLWVALQLPGRFDAVRVAINQQFADADTPLEPGDELAFLPPISGG